MFDRVYCINLDRRPDRWRRFQAGLPQPWPFAPVERVAAVDGHAVRPPGWYGAPPPNLNHPPRDNWRAMTVGGWGCMRSHLRVWEDCLTAGVDSVLLFEDDAAFVPDFVDRVGSFLDAVPDDWDQIYLGGQHLECEKGRLPVAVNSQVIRGHNVNRTHAYAIRGEAMRAIYHQLSGQWQGHRVQDYHLDHIFGALHGEWRAYCPRRWMVGQAMGPSDVWGRQVSTLFWNEFGIQEREPDAVAC